MFTQPKHCPNPDCKHHETGKDWFIKKGYFKTKWNAQPVPRYKCKACGKLFSSHTFRSTYRQKKPYLNQQIFKLYSSRMTMRRIAKVLGCHRETVHKKFWLLASLARKEHERRLASGELQTNWVQFDEFETFEHTKFKPISVALAVRAKTGEIIEVQAAQFRSRVTQHIPLKYKDEYRPDHRPVAIEDCMLSIKKAARSEANLVIDSDESTHYGNTIKRVLPKARYRQLTSPRKQQKGEIDPLFMINHMCSRLRHDLSRMSRKTWVTTKLMERLQMHLDLFIAYQNGYKLAA